MAGDMSTATRSSEPTTTTGTATATTIKGASTLRNPPAPMDSSHRKKLDSSSHWSSVARTQSMAGSQKNQPSAQTAVPAISSGASDSRTTRGCRQ